MAIELQWDIPVPEGMEGLEALLGSRGGVHFAPLSAAQTVESRAFFTVGKPREERCPPPLPCLSLARNGSLPAYRWEADAFVFTVLDTLPPRLWQLPIVGERLGAILTECGVAALWLDNARELRLVQPVSDVRSTACALPLWAETPEGAVSLFAANDSRRCQVRFGRGWAEYEKELAARRVCTRVSIENDALTLRVRGAEGLPLCWLLRPTMAEDASALRVSVEDGVFRAENPECYLQGTVLRAAASVPCEMQTDFTPPALCLRCTGEEETVFRCGCGELDTKPAPRDWDALCTRVRVHSGDGAIDRYVNQWCVYQTLCCRLLARSSLYQSGGAYGFRDQLQDAVNLLPVSMDYARARILDCCRHQYAEGDVMHWWHRHPEGDRGLRSRCSDDLLWLVWALCEYAEQTGDYGFALKKEPFLHSAPLAEDEHDRYETLSPSGKGQSLLQHAKAALERCTARGFGAHGLPLMLSGDWNDGFDACDGESVWLGFFLSHVSGRFAGLLRRLKAPDAARYEALSAQMLRAAEASFNGRYYRRGYWADGSALGGEERIDLLPQAWAAFCGAEHADEALDAALKRLVDEERSLIKLFDPPFTEGERSPGYLTGYGPGIRENGGQYTHGAIWLALALIRRGRRDEGRRLLRLLLPESHEPLRYEAEPFVLAADVYSAPGLEERAGWSWYTGSAGWYLRAALALEGE